VHGPVVQVIVIEAESVVLAAVCETVTPIPGLFIIS
jgi:hypothetical protein